MPQERAHTTQAKPLETYNGAESLVATLVESGVEVCFANPGTSEMHFVSALDRISGMRPVLCLFEGVVTGAADGYARMTGKPACTLLHLGPGFANGMANIHNARRAQSPMVNIVGDHATYHERYNAPLKSNVTGFATAISHWMCRSESPRTVAVDAARAVQAARQAPGQVATLILPADTAWLPAERPSPRLEVCPPSQVSDGAIAAAAQALSSGKKTAILMDGYTLCRSIKDDPALTNLPVYLFSSLITEETLHKGQSVRADGQFPKPQTEMMAREILADLARKCIESPQG